MEDTQQDRADQAFKILTSAIDAAITGTFPTGLNGVEAGMQVKGALQFLSDVLKEKFGVVDPEPEAPAEEPECRMGEPEAEAQLERNTIDLKAPLKRTVRVEEKTN